MLDGEAVKVTGHAGRSRAASRVPWAHLEPKRAGQQ